MNGGLLIKKCPLIKAQSQRLKETYYVPINVNPVGGWGGECRQGVGI